MRVKREREREGGGDQWMFSSACKSYYCQSRVNYQNHLEKKTNKTDVRSNY